MNKKALIITGRIACLLSQKKILMDLFQNHDVYVITSNEYKDIDLSFFHLKSILYIEESTDFKQEQEFLLSLNEGSKLLQWQKLHLAILKIRDIELSEGFEYESITKVRTDIIFDAKDSNFFPISPCENTFYMNSDFCFSANRKVFMLLSDFYYKCLTFYYGRELPLCVIDKDQKVDLKAGRFNWIRLANNNPNGSSGIEQSINKLKFSSEAVFLTEILNNDLSIKRLIDRDLKLFSHRYMSVEIEKLYDGAKKSLQENKLDKLFNIISLELPNEFADIFRDAYFKTTDLEYKQAFIKKAHSIRPAGPGIAKEYQLSYLMLNKKVIDEHLIFIDKVADNLPWLIIFSPMDKFLVKGHEFVQDPWGVELVKKIDVEVNCIYISAIGKNTWYRSKLLAEYLSEIGKQLKGCNVVGYGFSMGAFGVSSFGEVLNIKEVLLVSPVSTLNKEAAYFDNSPKYLAYRKLDWDGDFSDGVRNIKSGYCLFDGLSVVDKGHADRFIINKISFVGMGHNITRAINSGLVYYILVCLLKQKDIKYSTIAKFLRYKRTLPEYYRKMSERNFSSPKRLKILTKFKRKHQV